MIPQIQFDYDYIEILGDRYLKLSSRRFVKCPFKDDEFGVTSPRCFQPFKLGELTRSDGGYFSSSVFNSFPELPERVNFLNKFYQCLLCYQLPHKAKKLVVVGEIDSGKSSWCQILKGLIPEAKIAILSKEKHFGASMIKDDTQLLYVDEWNAEIMSSDLLKTLLQGGTFPQSIKHLTPKNQQMNAGVYITCNNIPNFGDEDESVKHRLAIYDTISLPEKNAAAPQWMKTHAFECIVWMINVINSNLKYLEEEERFYELDSDVSAHAMPTQRMSSSEIEKIKLATAEIEISKQQEVDDDEICSVFEEANIIDESGSGNNHLFKS